jgi:hypothetical protein
VVERDYSIPGPQEWFNPSSGVESK